MRYFLIAIILFGCGDSFKHKPTVEVSTSILYLHDAANDHRITKAKKIIKDTLMPVSIDSFNIKKQWVRDSFYQIPIVDSARKDGRPMKDSVGNQMWVLNWYWLKPEALITDFNKEWE